MKNKVLVGIGSNTGDKFANIEKAIEILTGKKEISGLKSSSLYETLPYGVEDQPNFINCAVSFYSGLNLKDLFFFLKETEKKIGRIERFRWGPREIDLDLLFFGDVIYNDEEITVPHPGIEKRDFVIVPAAEIEGKFYFPGKSIRLEEMNTDLLKKNIVRKIMN